ncbi:cytochrome P450 [Methylobacterium sp. A54F]
MGVVAMQAGSSKFRVAGPEAPGLSERLAELAALPGLARTLVGSMTDAWPDEVYTEPLVEARMLGRRIYFVLDPALIRALFVDHPGSLVGEEIKIRALTPALGQGLITAEGAHWRVQRRTAAPMFRPERVRGFVPAMAACARATRDAWRARTDPEAPLDIAQEMSRTTFEIIAATMVSGDRGFDVARFGQAVEHYLGQTGWTAALAMFGLPRWMPHPGRRRGRRGARYMRGSVAAAIARRRATGEPGADLLGLLLQARDPETGLGMPDESLVDNLLTFVTAGHETTALALTWALRLVADHPEVEARMLAELDGTDPADPAGVDGLVYTRQVVMEAMRLFPPASLMTRRVTAPLALDGLRIPAGASVHLPIFALHRHARLWERPDAFDPDRFAPAIHAARDRHAYLPFGAGPRVCIGMGFALTESVAILATLLPAFRFRPLAAGLPRPRLRVTLRPQGGMPMRVTART